MSIKAFTRAQLQAMDRPAGYLAEMEDCATSPRGANVLTFNTESHCYQALLAKYRPPTSSENPRSDAATPSPQPSPVVTPGPIRWHQLHSRARRPVLDKTAELAWIAGLADGLGGCPCNAHWAVIRGVHPPTIDTVAEYTAWALIVHNEVRKLLNQPPWPASSALGPRPIRYRDAAGRAVAMHNLHLGKSAVLACNGPSLRSIDPAALAGLDVMAINNAAAVIRPTYWVGGDQASNFTSSIFSDPAVTKFYQFLRRNELLDGRPAAFCPGMVFTQLDDEFDPSTWLAKTCIAWGGNDELRTSMAIGLRVLIDLGYRQIYLVGCDWQMNAERPYASDHTKSDEGVSRNNRLYAAWGERFAALVPELATHGVSVINCTPGSKLTAFPAGELSKISTTTPKDVMSD